MARRDTSISREFPRRDAPGLQEFIKKNLARVNLIKQGSAHAILGGNIDLGLVEACNNTARCEQISPSEGSALSQLKATRSMTKLRGTTSHIAAEIAELRRDRELAIEYLKAAMDSLGKLRNRAAGQAALRSVADAYRDLGQLADDAGISRESLNHALSPAVSAQAAANSLWNADQENLPMGSI